MGSRTGEISSCSSRSISMALDLAVIGVSLKLFSKGLSRLLATCSAVINRVEVSAHSMMRKTSSPFVKVRGMASYHTKRKV